ncbi:hypothetical protein BGZ47_002522 [Haplosporangium gracile]|nr:hypothetical protein BGZ47_002522 [Haplosporangium gracile]
MEPPVAYKRLQFPVKRAFALAVDDVPEGVMFDGLGLDLTYPMTTPGKLPSTLSRCRDPSRLKVYVPRGRFPGQPGHYTRNPLSRVCASNQEELDDFDDDTVAAAIAASEIEEDDDEDDDEGEDRFGDIDDLTHSRADVDAFNNAATPAVRTATAPISVRTTTRPTATITRTTLGIVKHPDDPDGQINSHQAFTAFLDRLNSGKERTYTRTAYQDFIRIPDQFLFTPRPPLQHRAALSYAQVQDQFLLEIFPDLQSAPVRSQTMMSNVILTERDDDARTYNERALEMQAHLSTLQAQ